MQTIKNYKLLFELHKAKAKDINVALLQELKLDISVKDAKLLKQSLKNERFGKEQYSLIDIFDRVKSGLNKDAINIKPDAIKSVLNMAKLLDIKFTADKPLKKYKSFYGNHGEWYSGKYSHSRKSDWRLTTYEYYVVKGLALRKKVDTVFLQQSNSRLVDTINDTLTVLFCKNKDYKIDAVLNKYGNILELIITDKYANNYHLTTTDSSVTSTMHYEGTDIYYELQSLKQLKLKQAKILDLLTTLLTKKVEAQHRVLSEKVAKKSPELQINAKKVKERWGFCDTGISSFCDLADLDINGTYKAIDLIKIIKAKRNEIKNLSPDMLPDFRKFYHWLSRLV